MIGNSPLFFYHPVLGQFQVDVKEGRGGGCSDLTVQLTLYGKEVNMTTVPKYFRYIFFFIFQNFTDFDGQKLADS